MLTGELGMLLVAIGAALILARLWRMAEARAARLQLDCDGLTTRTEELAADLAKQTRSRKRQAEELATLRNRADKAKRRQSKTPEQPLGTAARIRDHEVQLERAERDRDRARTERDELSEEVARLKSRLDASGRVLAEASGVAASPVPSESSGALERTESDLASARAQLVKREEEISSARQTEARLRKRMNNQEQLYASLRAELDVKKDRLRTQEEQLQRLQALKVAVLD